MIAVALVQDDKETRSGIDASEISEIIQQPGSVIWVDVVAPTDEDLATLDEEFDFHPLALQAVRHKNARPEIDIYDRFIYLNFYVVSPTEAGTHELQMISFFLGSNYLVTVHDHRLKIVDEALENWQASTAETGTRPVGLLLYSVLDPIVDEYFTVIDRLSDHIEQLEDAIFEGRQGLQDLFEAKKQVMLLRRITAPERDVLNALIRWETPVIHTSVTIYMQDVYDHLLRVTDSLDGYRDLLSNVLDAHLSVTSNRLNLTMKRLTASSIILMAMTLVAGIYGMNFVHMPELSWGLGYVWALGLMAVLGVGLLFVLRRVDWI